jgi:hypothetical protein
VNHKTTAKHFKIFQDECEKWIEYFGLKDWDVYYAHHNDVGKFASINFDTSGRVSTIFLVKNWTKWKPTVLLVKKRAFHEVCELLLADMYALADNRYIQENDADRTAHIIIRKLENTVFRDVKL